MAKQPNLADLVAEVTIRALAHPAVQAAVLRRAQQIFPRAQHAAYKAGRIHFADNMRVETGVRPGTKSPTGLKRPYARVISTITPEQHAADSRRAKTSRTKILRSAAR